MSRKDNEVRKLMESIAPSTAHQIKSYYMKYVQWCEERNLIQLEEENGVRYDQLPLSPKLVHCFILEKVVLLPSAIYSLQELKNYIDSFLFLNKLCSIHTGEESGALLETYLANVFKLHQRWHSISTGGLQTSVVTKLIKISLNMWNPATTELSDKYFKTSMEKLRFLTDFHMYSYLNWSYKERASLKLSSFTTTSDGKGLLIRDCGANKIRGVLLPQDCPLICPLTTLAAYFYLRFYGVKPVYRGDGFPNLLGDFNLPLIRGKSLSDYPKEETLSNYYSSVFKYCSLGYKRRVYFNAIPENKNENFDVNYPESSEIDPQQANLVDFDEVFPDDIPIDFRQILNVKTPQVDSQNYQPISSSNPDIHELPPNDLLVQVFPEIEEYKRENYNELSKGAQDFLKVMELLRNTFVSNLPWIYKFFPDHELFKDQSNLFQNSDFQIFINERISHILHPSSEFSGNEHIPPILRSLPGYHSNSLDQNGIFSYLVEPNLMVEIKPESTQSEMTVQNSPSMLDPSIKSEVQFTPISDSAERIKKESFKYIQFQTLSNVNLIIDFLEKIFEKLEMKRSTREFVINKIEVLRKTTKNRLNSVTPEEILKYFEDILGEKEGLRIVSPNERRTIDAKETKNPISNKANKEKRFRLLSIDDDDSDDSDSEKSEEDKSSNEDDSDNDNDEDEDEDGEGENVMQSELRTMIDELVSTKIANLFEIKMEQLEMKLENRIEKMVNEKVESIIETKINKRLRTLERDTPQQFKKQKKETMENSFVNNSVTTESASTNAVGYPFKMSPGLSSIEEIIQEWYTPDPKQNNECVHSMNKKYKSKWRSGFESLYRERKPIVDFFIYLVNVEKIPRPDAIKTCWELKEQNSYTLKQLSNYLRDWKDNHGASFKGLLSESSH
ncbi:Centromere DNA-binding protein complex CBF3 subunit A [Nakaseomyces bracarensis]|uniref:Centromere DNA-binding protein complex CBF3 subunit A n=1 Tax=Nakaseomyces bracarensis TaxID=273131 RepID=A0ABR4NPN6_9SACH